MSGMHVSPKASLYEGADWAGPDARPHPFSEYLLMIIPIIFISYQVTFQVRSSAVSIDDDREALVFTFKANR